VPTDLSCGRAGSDWTQPRPRQGSWAAALQGVLLAGTALVTLGSLPLLFLTASWYLSMAAPPEAPPPPETAQQRPEAEARGNGRPPVLTTVSASYQVSHLTALCLILKCRASIAETLIADGKHDQGNPSASQGSRWRCRSWVSICHRHHMRAAGSVRRAWMSAVRGAYTADTHLREALSSNMDALVAVGLIVGTLLGATLLSIFFAVQIGAPRLSMLCQAAGSNNIRTTTALHARRHKIC